MTRIGLYLGPSLRHDSSNYLVMNIETEIFYPQLYVKLNDLFETVRPKSKNLLTIYHWKLLFIFNKSRPHHVQTAECESSNQQ